MRKNFFEKLENFKTVKGEKVRENESKRVKIVRLKSDESKVFALKILSKQNKKDVPFLIKEIKILKSLRHPHIVKFYNCLEDKKNIYIFLEFVRGGDLMEVLQRKLLPQEQKLKVFYQLCTAVEYLHERNIIH